MEISDKPGEEEAEPAFKVNDLPCLHAHIEKECFMNRIFVSIILKAANLNERTN